MESKRPKKIGRRPKREEDKSGSLNRFQVLLYKLSEELGEETDTMTEASGSDYVAEKITRRKRPIDFPDSAASKVKRTSLPMKQEQRTVSMPPGPALGDFRSIRLKQEKHPEIIVKAVAEPRLTKGKQQECLHFPVADRLGVIRTCVAFGQTARSLYGKVCVSRVYVLSGYGVRKPSEEKFNRDPEEIVLDDLSEINPSEFDNFGNFLSYRSIVEALKTEQRSHIAGMVRRIGELTDSQQGRMTVRDVVMMDESNKETKVTFYKEDAKNFNFLVGQTLKVTFVRGVTLNKDAYLMTTPFSTIAISKTEIQVDESKAKVLSCNYSGVKVQNLKQLKIAESDGKYDIASLCTIATIRLSNPMYIGCDVEDCRKKVSLGTNNRAVCPTHGFRYRTGLYFKIAVQITDSSGSIWTTLFDRHVSAISGLTTDSIEKLPTKSQNEKITSELKDVSVTLTVDKKGKGRNAQYTVQKISKV
ncbi:probable replication factor A 73 kDa subunit isoform X2 [Ptychodera flava]|uniref:probable replication factor A 73 kDa subunit isoform X2 n=1 Tax=Ptychodera flava TaxID=63121 RepID=UPI00396A6469